jgi:hypothetical protein
MASFQMAFGMLLIGVMAFLTPDSASTSSVIFFSVMGLMFFVNGARTLKGK